MIALIVGAAWASSAQQGVADFYHGKQVQLRIASAPDTDYDITYDRNLSLAFDPPLRLSANAIGVRRSAT
jgi:hypothetical protein